MDRQPVPSTQGELVALEPICLDTLPATSTLDTPLTRDLRRDLLRPIGRSRQCDLCNVSVHVPYFLLYKT
jgi:hypothetical protein